MKKIIYGLSIITGLAVSYMLGLALNQIVVYTIDIIFGSEYNEYIWTQYHVMGFSVFYMLYIFLLLVYLYKLPVLVKQAEVLDDDELPRISVVIPAYNEEKIIGRAIESVLNSNYPKSKLEVIVVDDGSSDNTYAVASRYPVKVIRHEKNQGRGKAVMTGYRNASGDIVVTIDADTILDRDALRLVASYMVRDKRIGASCGRLKPLNSRGLLGIGQRVEYAIGYAYTKSLKSSMGWMLIPSGAFSAYRRELVVDADIHDTIAEDFDLGLHVIRKGYRLGYVKEAVAYTEIPSNLASYIRQRTRWSVGGLQVLAKHRDMMFNPRYGSIGLFALPFHLVFGFMVMVMEAYGLSFLILLLLAGYFAIETFLVLVSWLILLKIYTTLLLIPGFIYSRSIIGEKIGLHHLILYWLIYYYLLLYTTVRGIIVYFKYGSTRW